MAKTPEMKGNKLSFLYSLSRFLPNFLQSSDAASTYLKKSDAATTYLAKTDASTTYLAKADATITIKYAASATPATKSDMSDTDGTTMTHIGIIKKAGLDPDVPANYNWISRTIPES